MKFSTTSAFAATKEIKSDKWHAATVLNKTDNEDESIYVTIQNENGIRKLAFYPVETTAASNAMLTASLNWTGWGSPRTVYSDATAEQNLQNLSTALIFAFLTSCFGFVKTIAATIAPFLLQAALSDQRTVWLGRTTWLNDDYTAYIGGN